MQLPDQSHPVTSSRCGHLVDGVEAGLQFVDAAQEVTRLGGDGLVEGRREIGEIAVVVADAPLHCRRGIERGDAVDILLAGGIEW